MDPPQVELSLKLTFKSKMNWRHVCFQQTMLTSMELSKELLSKTSLIVATIISAPLIILTRNSFLYSYHKLLKSQFNNRNCVNFSFTNLTHSQVKRHGMVPFWIYVFSFHVYQVLSFKDSLMWLGGWGCEPYTLK